MTTVPASVVVPETEISGRIYQTLDNALETVRRIFREAGVPLPALQFVSNGTIAYDDELVAVEALLLRPGAPGIPALMPVKSGTPYSLEAAFHIIRKVPVENDQGEAPTADEIEESARTILLDWWTFYEGVLLGRRQGGQGDPGNLQGAPYREIMLQQIAPYGPQGHVGGLVATLVLQLV